VFDAINTLDGPRHFLASLAAYAEHGQGSPYGA
jgi:hypothetical protein